MEADKADQQTQPKPEEASSRALAGHHGGEGGLGRVSPAASAKEVLNEAASLLKSLRLPSVKAMRISSLEVHTGGRTLLDGSSGAGKGDDHFEAVAMVKAFAVGDTCAVHCALGILAEIEYCVHWEGTKFELLDPPGCVLDAQLESGCPTVEESLGLEVIKEVERHFIQRRARLAVIRGEGNPGNLPDQRVKERKELREMFPLVPEPFWHESCQAERDVGIFVEGIFPGIVINDGIYEKLNKSREGPERFGFKGSDEYLQKRVEEDTLLWLRQYYLFHRAKKASSEKVLYLKEQPEDPERYLDGEVIAKQRYPSYCAFPEWTWMKEENDFIEVSFDQGRTGHPKRKPTTLGTNIYELQQLHGLRGPGTSPERGDA
eukprot:s181_g7.t1